MDMLVAFENRMRIWHWSSYTIDIESDIRKTLRTEATKNGSGNSAFNCTCIFVQVQVCIRSALIRISVVHKGIMIISLESLLSYLEDEYLTQRIEGYSVMYYITYITGR